MTKKLKIGLVLMILAVVLMPIAVVLKNTDIKITVIILMASMLMELIGLVFVISNILDKRKS